MKVYTVYFVARYCSKDVFKVFSTRGKAIQFVNDNNDDDQEGDEYYAMGPDFEVE